MSHNIAFYARVSADRQVQEGTIGSQIDSLREYAKELGYNADEDMFFIDNGISGATLIRPALDRLRDKASGGELDKIIVLCPDRLARKHAHQLILIEEFHRLGVEIIFANREISDSLEDQLLLQIQGVISEYEREKILERSRRGKLSKAKKGKVSVLSGAPYGYIYLKGNDCEEARYEIHQEEAKVVRRIFDMYTEKIQSIGTIAKTLSAEHVSTKRGSTNWERSVIWLILKNPAYMGQAAYRKTESVFSQRPTKLSIDRGGYTKQAKASSRDRPIEEWIFIPVPAIISEEMYQMAQERLEDNKRLSPRNNKRYEYLISGIIRCAICGYSIYGKPASNSKYKRCYYRCMGQDGHRWPNGRVCGGHPIRVEVLDDLVWEQTRRLIEHPDSVLEEYSNRLNKTSKQTKNFDNLLAAKKQDIRCQEIEKQRLLDLYQTGVINMPDIEPRLKSIRAKIKKLESEYGMIVVEQSQEQQKLQLIEQFSKFSEKLKNNLDTMTFNDKKKVIRLLVSEVLVDSEKEKIIIRHVMPITQKCPLRSGSKRGALGCPGFWRHFATVFENSHMQALAD